MAVRDKGCGQTGCACVPASVCLTLGDPTDCSLPGSSVCKDSLGKISGVGCRQHSQGAFPTRGWNEVPPVSCTGMQALYRKPHLGSLSRQVRTAYFGYLMQRADSLEKTLILGEIEGRRRSW